MPIRWLDVLRDALALVIASALVQAAALGAGASAGATEALVFGVFAVGFCVSGCLSPRRRFRHLGLVAFATWMLLALIAALTGSSDRPSAYVAVLINQTLLAMLVGGVASLAIVKRPAEPTG